MKLFHNLINQYPFYQKARNLWAQTQINQIIKGLTKYGTPLVPRNHTADELVTHALEEAVDLTHYIVALKEVIDELEEKNREYEVTMMTQRNEITALKEQLAALQWESGVIVKKPEYFDLDD